MSENEILRTLPILPLRGMMVFPYMMVHLDAGRDPSISALEKAMLQEEHHVFLLAQRDADVEEPEIKDLYNVGTVAEIKHLVKLPDGAVRVLVEGLHRGQIVEVNQEESQFIEAQIREYEDPIVKTTEMEALVRVVVHEFEQWVKSSQKIPAEAMVSVSIIEDAGRLADMIAGHINLKLEDRQRILEAIDVKARLECLYGFIKRERDILEIERKIGSRVRKQIEKVQKEYYLREQIKAISKELGENEDVQAEIAEYKEQMSKLKMPQNVAEKINKELGRLAKMPPMTPEGAVIRTYIDSLLALPWGKFTKDNFDIDKAQDVLDKDHYGLKKVKERILEYLAVRALSKSTRGPILCLVGPPGVGKTSLASSIAKAIKRKFTRISLGGVLCRDVLFMVCRPVAA